MFTEGAAQRQEDILKCPDCGQTERIGVEHAAHVEYVWDYGTQSYMFGDLEHGEPNGGSDATTTCMDCAFTARLVDFQVPGTFRSADRLKASRGRP
jgi:hypothetical protein